MSVLIKELVATNGRTKVVIEKRDDNLLEVSVFKLSREVDKDDNEIWSGWEPAEGQVLTDTLERAETIAMERLKVLYA